MPLDPFTLPGEISSGGRPLPQQVYKQYAPRCWIENDRLFVAFHLKTKPTIPSRSFEPFSSTSEMYRIHWIREGYQYLAFLPFPVDCRGPLLSRLAVDELHIPITRFSSHGITSFAVDLTLISSWERLEVGITRAAQILLVRLDIPGICFPPSPDCSKLRSHDSERDKVISLALETRDRFLPWFALISFCISLLDGPSYFLMKSGQEEMWSKWVGALLASNIHPEWVGMLVDSCLSQFHRTHLGTVIEFDRDPNAIFVSAMIDHEVPVIYSLDPLSVDCLPHAQLRKSYLDMFCKIINRNGTVADLNKWLRKYTPPRDHISRLLATGNNATNNGHQLEVQNVTHADDREDLFDFSIHDSAASDDISDSFPSLDPSSGQKPMENRVDFFRRREEENSSIIATENHEERRRREDREYSMSSFPVPGRNSKTKVFVWDQIGIYEIRSKRDRGMFGLLWSIYGKHEMRFDALRNEWDLWAGDGKAISEKKHELEERFGKPLLQSDFRSSDGVAKLKQYNIDVEDALRQDIVEILGGGAGTKKKGGRTDQSVSFASKVSMLDTLKIWYGFTPGDDLSSLGTFLPQSGVIKIFNKLSVNNRARSILVDCVSPSFPQENPSLRLFLALQLAGEYIPKTMYDLSVIPAKDIGNPRLRVRKSKYEAQTVCDALSPKMTLYSIDIIRVQVPGQVNEPENKRLFVWDAMTAVAIKRLSAEQASSFELIVGYLIERGANFLVGVPRNRIGAPFQDIRVKGLGRRWRGYCPDEADYAVYRQKCQELFSIDRTRRALRYGGILWRIALDYIDAAGEDTSPSQEAMNEPLWICDSDTQRPEFVEDGLSMEEIRLILGSYEIKDKESKDKAVFCSFWPPPWVWDNSGFSVGYWTPDCEDWFVNTQRKYEAGELTLARIEEWKARLKRFGDTKKLKHAVNSQCESFLTHA